MRSHSYSYEGYFGHHGVAASASADSIIIILLYGQYPILSIVYVYVMVEWSCVKLFMYRSTSIHYYLETIVRDHTRRTICLSEVRTLLSGVGAATDEDRREDLSRQNNIPRVI